MWAPMSQAWPSRNSTKLSLSCTRPVRTAFTSVPLSLMPASTVSSTVYSCRARRLEARGRSSSLPLEGALVGALVAMEGVYQGPQVSVLGDRERATRAAPASAGRSAALPGIFSAEATKRHDRNLRRHFRDPVPPEDHRPPGRHLRGGHPFRAARSPAPPSGPGGLGDRLPPDRQRRRDP